ncbi:hypothetical protein [Sphingorhabdus sp. Alg239-R122]|uniref:hypothetical protein n=1 Tax=Sphingorhabdus sp. Alg239-R122 TaxID=2305989 RepID=UPI001F07130C|nr:hypothetical protein [Sphingorhabdus sp. Alg239-R122]
MADGNIQSQAQQKKWGKGWKIGLVLLLLIFAAMLFYFLPAIKGLTQAGTAYGARVTCSCRYIGGRTLDDCKKDFEDGMEMVSVAENTGTRRIDATVPMLAHEAAEYREGYGCVLLTEEERDAG